jgi:hypothetical protein
MLASRAPVRELSSLWLSFAFISASYTLIAPGRTLTAGLFSPALPWVPEWVRRELRKRDSHSARAREILFFEGARLTHSRSDA